MSGLGSHTGRGSDCGRPIRIRVPKVIQSRTTVVWLIITSAKAL